MDFFLSIEKISSYIILKLKNKNNEKTLEYIYI